MTICPGGLTQPKAGIPTYLSYASSGAGLLSVIPRLAKLGPLAYALSAVSIATSDLCAHEPPAMPTLTQAEVVALSNNDFFNSNWTSGLSKLKDMLANVAWYQLCECVTGGAQTLPTPPVQPAPPVVVPTNIPNTSVTCESDGPTTRTWAALGGGITNAAMTGIETHANPVGQTWTLTIANPGPGTSSTSTWSISKFAASPSTESIVLETFTLGVTDTVTRTYAWDPAWPRIRYSGSPTGGATGQTVTTTASVTCQGDASIGPSNCCPPDPLVVAKLDKLDALVTLLQRQLAPFAYVLGTAHSGLTGHGVLSVQGLLGAKIEITTDSATLGSAGASPVELFDRGYLTWGTADGYPQSERLERSVQLSLPARCSAFTDLAYDLHPGITATITEIVREA